MNNLHPTQPFWNVNCNVIMLHWQCQSPQAHRQTHMFLYTAEWQNHDNVDFGLEIVRSQDRGETEFKYFALPF